jgi:sugar phosphate permease
MFDHKFETHKLNTFDKIRPWLILFSAASFVFLINSSFSLNGLVPYIIPKYNLSNNDIGLLFASYYYTNLLTVFLGGIILDKYSTRKILLICMVITNLSILAFALTKNLQIMIASRMLLGIAGSFSMISCFKLIKQWFEPRRVALVTGIAITFANFGTLFAQTPLVFIIEKFNIKTGLLTNFWFGLLFLTLAYFTIQDRKSSNIQSISGPKLDIWHSVKKVITTRQNWIIGGYSLFTALPGIFFCQTWGIAFLEEIKGLSRLEGSYIISLYTIGSIVGALFISWLADKYNSNKMILSLSNALIFVLLLTIFLVKIPAFGFMILFFSLGVLINSQVLTYPLVGENNDKAILNTATGFVATLLATNGILMQLLTHLMKNYTIRNITIDHYTLPLCLLLIVTIASFILTLFIKNNSGGNR